MGAAPIWSCSRSRRLTVRLRSDELPSALPGIRPSFRPCEISAKKSGSTEEMVEHQVSRPCIPVWKVLADGHQRVSLNTYARNEIGVPCGSCTHLNGFADRCLGCSANETSQCRTKSAECFFFGISAPPHHSKLRRCGGERRLRAHVLEACLSFSAGDAVFVAVTG